MTVTDNPLHRLEDMGLSVALGSNGKLRLHGLARLSEGDARAAVALARTSKRDIMQELAAKDLRLAEGAFQNLLDLVARAGLRIKRHPEGMLCPDLDDIEARHGFSLRCYVADVWDAAWPLIYARAGQLDIEPL